MKRDISANLYQKCLILDSMILLNVGGVVASWLVRSTPKQVLRVRALAGDIVLCS